MPERIAGCAAVDSAEPPPSSPLPPGTLAPDFSLVPIAGQEPLTLSGLRGQPVVLAFASDEWDPARAEQKTHLGDLLTWLDRSQTALIGLSREGQGYRMSFADEQIEVPLLAGLSAQDPIARQYGVHGGQAWFVVDSAGIIRWSFAAPAGVSPTAEAVLSALEALTGTSAPRGVTRREFMAAALAGALALTIPLHRAEAAETTPVPVPLTVSVAGLSPSSVPVTLSVNGTTHKLRLEPRVTLLDALRERIGLTGSKKGCDHGQCGACTVLVDGRRVNSCLSLAIMQQGKKITTIEGLAHGETLHPIQAAFLEHDGFQCGYCTPGQIVSAVGMLQEPCGPEDADVRECMSGNICRCGAYPNIVAAVQEVRKGGKRDASV